MRRPTLIPLALLLPMVAATPALAHFKLTTPANWTTQNNLGDPQKTQPCGNENAAADAGIITEYKAGSTIAIEINETIAHPGHYRVSLAADQASLPRDPDGDVKPGAMDCGSLAINPNPTLPLLADGLLARATGSTGPQTMQVTLPAGMTCEKCVLQVVQFMSDHGAPCFYHHCANIKISATGPSPTDAGVPPVNGADAGPGPNPSTGTTGGCSTSGTGATGAGLLALAVGLLVARRRRFRRQ